jgi:sec-independent protein translocase protein TatA
MLGHQELLLIFLIVLLVFGGQRIPEVARALGKAVREFRKAKDGIESDAAGTATADAPPGRRESQVKPSVPDETPR